MILAIDAARTDDGAAVVDRVGRPQGPARIRRDHASETALVIAIGDEGISPVSLIVGLNPDDDASRVDVIGRDPIVVDWASIIMSPAILDLHEMMLRGDADTSFLQFRKMRRTVVSPVLRRTVRTIGSNWGLTQIDDALFFSPTEGVQHPPVIFKFAGNFAAVADLERSDFSQVDDLISGGEAVAAFEILENDRGGRAHQN